MKAVKRAILLCWFMLIVCFIIKLIGGNWFEIICNNEHFVYMCSFLDKHQALCYIIAFPFYVCSTFLILLSCSFIAKTNWKQFLIMLITISIIWSFQFINQYVKFIMEIVMYVLMPSVLHFFEKDRQPIKTIIKKNWYRGIIGCVLSILFQFISLATRNIGIKVIDDNTLITLITMLDFYIMVVLYYLYTMLKIKKGGK